MRKPAGLLIRDLDSDWIAPFAVVRSREGPILEWQVVYDGFGTELTEAEYDASPLVNNIHAPWVYYPLDEHQIDAVLMVLRMSDRSNALSYIERVLDCKY